MSGVEVLAFFQHFSGAGALHAGFFEDVEVYVADVLVVEMDGGFICFDVGVVERAAGFVTGRVVDDDDGDIVHGAFDSGIVRARVSRSCSFT